MKITFIVPSTSISGGVRVIFEYANRLQKRGHNVSVLYPLIPLNFGLRSYDYRRNFLRIVKFLSNFKRWARVDWFDVKANLMIIPTLSEKYIPNSDIIVATAWPTAYYVNSYGKCKGRKVYFIQGYEIWNGPRDKVEKTYKLPLRKVVVSSWLKNLMEDKFQERVKEVIMNGVNLDQFYNLHKKYNSKKRILMYYSNSKLKGAEDGIKALEIVKNRYPEIQLVMFGTHKGRNVPRYVEFHRKPSKERLRELYSSCDIFLYPSRSEGFGLPPMEAMACKCAVVTTNVGAIPDYVIPGKTALVSPPNSSKGLAENLIQLIEDEEKLRNISIAGYNYIKKFGWEQSATKLEKLFKNLRVNN